jgi:hypothetical protein
MNIVVDGSSPANSTLNANIGPERTASGAARSGTQQQAQPILRSSQTQPSPNTKVVPVNYIPPQDVVEVHQASDVKGQIVVEYLDKAKNVVLQVPSAAELDFESAIAQEFQRVGKTQASNRAAPGYGAGVKGNGNQL